MCDHVSGALEMKGRCRTWRDCMSGEVFRRECCYKQPGSGGAAEPWLNGVCDTCGLGKFETKFFNEGHFSINKITFSKTFLLILNLFLENYYPKRQEGFSMACKKNNCICKGFPNPNYRVPLLKGKVTLERCSQACRERSLCFGFEYWDWPGFPGESSANCLLCPTFPNKRYTINVVASPVNRTYAQRRLSTVFQKTNVRDIDGNHLL